MADRRARWTFEQLSPMLQHIPRTAAGAHPRANVWSASPNNAGTYCVAAQTRVVTPCPTPKEPTDSPSGPLSVVISSGRVTTFGRRSACLPSLVKSGTSRW